jgi:pimeloyl-ACP methyl ester carboxylesterase
MSLDGQRRGSSRLASCSGHDGGRVGPVIYRLNVNRPVMRRMVAGHVYSDPAFLDGERLEQKLAVIEAPGARFASVRFVTGRLDPLGSRDEFLDLARRAAPILLIYGAETPRRSRAEMEALAALPQVRTVILPRGKLAFYEEFPDATSDAINAFLGEAHASASEGGRPPS